MPFAAALRSIATALTLLVLLAMAATASAAVSITRTSSPVLYSDMRNGLSGSYVAYRISTDSPINDAWARIGNFSGPNIGLAPAETGLYHLGYVGAGAETVYFYLSTRGASLQSESHTVSVYEGNPSSGATLGAATFSMTQQDTIQSNSNKVTSVITGPTPATLGGIVTIKVTGDTGNTGGNMAFTAATDPNWPASAYRLNHSVINLPDGSTLTDAPYIAAYNGIIGTYVATYTFTAQDTISAPAATNATGYILSGQSMKHTQVGGSAGNPTPPPISPTTGNALVVSSFSNIVSLPPVSGGTVTYTVRLTNSGTADVTVGDIVDTLPTSPAALSYVAGSAVFNGVALADPSITGSRLTWSGSFTIPAGGSRDLTFRAQVPGISGTYTNSAIAHIGTVQIDSTLTTTDDAPAVSSLTVTEATVLTASFTPATIGIGRQAAMVFTITNSSGNPGYSGLGFTDTLPPGLTLAGSALSPQCGGTLSYAAGNVINFTGGTLASGSLSCTITVAVTGSTPGTYTNTFSGNISNLAGGLNAAGLSASLLVSAPALTKSFTPSVINGNQSSSVVFTISNGAGSPEQAGLSFTDNLPAGLVVTNPAAITNSCGGTVSALSGGEASITISGAALAAGSSDCAVSVPVRPTSAALTTYTNRAANITGLSSGLGNAVTDQTLTVVSTPTLVKAFTPATVGVGQPATLIFTVNNQSPLGQSKLSFTDLFPAGMVIATPPNVSSTCGGSVYRTGTTAAVTGGESAFDFADGAVAPNSSCTVAVNVTAMAAGSYINGSGNITSVVGVSNGVTAQTLTVAGTTLRKAFADAILITGTSTSLTFTITNGAKTPAQAGIGFTDTLAAGLSLSGPAVSPQCGGTLSFAGNAINFTGGSLASGAPSCTITVTVTGSAAGTYSNSYPANITNLAGGLNASGASAGLTVYPPPNLVLSRSVSPANPVPGSVITYTFRVANLGGPAINVTPTDAMSPYTTLVMNPGGAGPFTFQEGVPASALTPGTPEYSTDGVTWSTTPPGNGNVVRWRLPMLGTMNGNASGPNFTVTFQAVVK